MEREKGGRGGEGQGEKNCNKSMSGKREREIPNSEIQRVV